MAKRVLVVQFRPGVARFDDGPGTQILDAETSAAWRDLAADCGEMALCRAFHESGAMERLVREAVAADPEWQEPDWRSWFVVQCPERATSDAARAMQDWRGVARVQVTTWGDPPWVLPASDPGFSADPSAVSQAQSHLGPSTGWPRTPLPGVAWARGMPGIDAFDAWRRPGGDGAGICLADVERGWTITHTDLPALAADGSPLVAGELSQVPSEIAHGDAVLGIVAAAANGSDRVGIAPATRKLRVASTLPSAAEAGSPFATAIAAAADSVGPGDIVLIEETIGSSAPLEHHGPAFDAIRTAVAAGRVVVAAAGNGGIDLDEIDGESSASGCAHRLNDSGSILVGCAYPPELVQMTSSNHGSRIDCFAWGDGVYTLGPNRAFAGTSAAAAIVAGVVMSIQGMCSAAFGSRLRPAAVREILRDPRFASDVWEAVGGARLPHGMPDLRKIAELALGLPDPYVRDFVGDDGAARLDGPFGASPDIALCDAPDHACRLDPCPDDASPGLDPVAPRSCVHLRVLNRGGSTAPDVVADVYWADLAPFVPSRHWTRAGRIELPPIPAHGSVAGTCARKPWFDPCGRPLTLIAVLGTRRHPPPAATEFLALTNLLWGCRVLGSVAWRSTVRLDAVARSVPGLAHPAVSIPLSLCGAGDERRLFRISIEVERGAYGEVWISARPEVAAKFVPAPAPIRPGVPFRLDVGPQYPCADVWLDAAERIHVELLLVGGSAPPPETLTLAVIQSLEGHEVGRATFLLRRPAR